LDIPDEVPARLAQQNLAPSYKSICMAILRNDHALTSLGYTAPASGWYTALKKIEYQSRITANAQLDLFL
jgi:predicted phosphoadenosine phosphosulfate sulfurtransferase